MLKPGSWTACFNPRYRMPDMALAHNQKTSVRTPNHPFTELPNNLPKLNATSIEKYMP